MDMKKILQAMDSVQSSPVSAENSHEMKRFMEIMTEGVSLPVQMAMDHYQKPQKPASIAPKDSVTRKYFLEAEQEVTKELAIKEQRSRMYAKKIADKILCKESASIYDIYTEEPEQSNPTDTVTMDIPLLIRLLEYSREDAKTDMDLHNVAEMLIKLGKNGETLSMDNYDQIVGDQKLLAEPMDESRYSTRKRKILRK